MLVEEQGTVRVEIGGAWYDLKEWLGWYEQARIEDARTRLYVPLVSALGGADRAEIQSTVVEANLMRLLVRLRAWSLPVPISEEAVKRLVPAHTRRLLARIAELELAEERLGLGEASSGSPSA